MGKELIKKLLRENLSKNTDKEKIDEGKLRSAIAGGLMGLGALGGAKAQAQAPIQPPIEQPAKKSMYGSPEERAARKAQRDANRANIENNYIKGAVNNNFYEVVDDMEYEKGLNQLKDIPFFDRKITYAAMGDGTKIKVFIKKYSQFIEKRGRQSDVDRYGGQMNKVNARGEIEYSSDDSPEASREHCKGSKACMDRRKDVESGGLKT